MSLSSHINAQRGTGFELQGHHLAGKSPASSDPHPLAHHPADDFGLKLVEHGRHIAHD